MQFWQFLSWKTALGALLAIIVLSYFSNDLSSQNFPAFTQQTPNPSNTSLDNATTSLSDTRSTTPSSVDTSSSLPMRPRYISNKNKQIISEERKDPGIQDMPSNLQRPSLITQAVLLTFLSLMPFIIMILTSFLKIVVVLSLLRTALGVQQAPPNQVINGVAFLLSLFIMYPTGLKMYDAAKVVINQTNVPISLTAPESSTYVLEVANAAAQPMKEFLKRNSSARHQALFYRLIYRGLPSDYQASLTTDDFIVLVPAYITGQLKDAFEIGVLIYIPFFVIDLVTSNILLAMGMMMLSPVTISMPLKLFLLVMLDGWTILIEGLVKTFR